MIDAFAYLAALVGSGISAVVLFPDVLIQIAIGTVPIGVAYLAYRSATDANKRTAETALRSAEANAEIERTKVDAEAFARAKAIYEDALNQLERQLDRLQDQFDKISEQLATEQDASNVMRAQVHGLQGHIQLLERTVAALRRQLATAGITPQLDPRLEHLPGTAGAPIAGEEPA